MGGNMAKRSKSLKLAKFEEVKGDAKLRAEIIMRNSAGDKGRAMEYCAASGDREALEIINPAPPDGQ